MFWSLISLVVISITLLATSGKTTGTYVFTTFDNTTVWTSGVACLLGMMQSALSLIGLDAATHMSEEMPHPGRDTPRAMVLSIVIGGVTYVKIPKQQRPVLIILQRLRISTCSPLLPCRY